MDYTLSSIFTEPKKYHTLQCNIARFAFVLRGGMPTPLKNMSVTWDDCIPN